jgi:hypothetical protein
VYSWILKSKGDLVKEHLPEILEDNRKRENGIDKQQNYQEA